MNYRKQYSLLILKYGTFTKPDDLFTERHHILPKSIGGSDSIDNLVYMVPRAHYIAHWLLWKIHRNRQMALAFKRMCEAPKNSKRGNRSGQSYARAKEALSLSMTGKPRPELEGSRNPMKRPEVAAKISVLKTEYWRSEPNRKYAARCSAKSYLVTSPDGCVAEVINLKEYCQTNRLNYSSLLYAAKVGGNPRRAKGYTCKEATNPCE